MRARSVATALVALTVGAAASVAVRRLGRRRRPALGTAPVTAPPAVAAPEPAPVDERDAVVLDFPRRPAPAPARPAVPARCGDSGGRTRAGAPCAARATSNGRCHHHRLAA